MRLLEAAHVWCFARSERADERNVGKQGLFERGGTKQKSEESDFASASVFFPDIPDRFQKVAGTERPNGAVASSICSGNCRRNERPTLRFHLALCPATVKRLAD